MFAVIYRGYIQEGRETEYQKLWHTIARYFKEQRGALGSCLYCSEDGMWLAYSRWPDKATRDASWSNDSAVSNELPSEIQQAIVDIKDCIDQERALPEIAMEVVDDML